MIETAVAFWENLKQEYIPPGEDLRALIHIHFGLALWLLATLLFRRGPASVLPLAIVWAATLLTEAADLYHFWPIQYDWVWYDTAGDLFNTLFWPTMLWLYFSFRKARRDRENDRASAGSES